MHSMTVSLEALEKAVTELQEDETAAAAKFTALAEEIKDLESGTVTQEQIDAITTKATEVGNALKTATEAA